MKKLHESTILKEGQRFNTLLLHESLRCPSSNTDLLTNNSNNNSQEESVLDYFASILVEAFLDKKQNENNKSSTTKESSDIRPSVDKGTGG